MEFSSSIAGIASVAFPGAMFAQAETISGGAGWVGAGLLGVVLWWLLFKHIPDKDKQIGEMLKQSNEERQQNTNRYDAERLAERDARHARANQFQQMMNEIVAQHKTDAEQDRNAFLQRNDNLKIAIAESIAAQTARLEMALINAMGGLCKWAKDHKS